MFTMIFDIFNIGRGFCSDISLRKIQKNHKILEKITEITKNHENYKTKISKITNNHENHKKTQKSPKISVGWGFCSDISLRKKSNITKIFKILQK
jgi:DNA-binding transcriptional regulator GbsR (MarR family)